VESWIRFAALTTGCHKLLPVYCDLSMKLVLVSSDVVWDKARNAPYNGIQAALDSVIQSGNGVFLVSSHVEPPWLRKFFPLIKFQGCPFKSRQNGQIVQSLLDVNKDNGLKHSDVVVFGVSDADFFMAVHSQTLLARCEWAANKGERIKAYGLPVREPKGIVTLLNILRDNEPWYFQGHGPQLEIFALTDAGTITELDSGALILKAKLKNCLKAGVVQNRKEFIAHLLSSLCATDTARTVDWWAWYPSSKANSEHTEVMREFCRLAQTTFGRKTRGPLFVRHKTAAARHMQKGSRTDPRMQIESVHLNPDYRGHLEGKTVAILDDYLTYGLSFGVASAILKKAGVARVLGIAMGKFGDCAEVYDIAIEQDDVFAPITAFKSEGYHDMMGKTSSAAQKDFTDKFKYLLS
jgi:hypothetical protein